MFLSFKITCQCQAVQLNVLKHFLFSVSVAINNVKIVVCAWLDDLRRNERSCYVSK